MFNAGIENTTCCRQRNVDIYTVLSYHIIMFNFPGGGRVQINLMKKVKTVYAASDNECMKLTTCTHCKHHMTHTDDTVICFYYDDEVIERTLRSNSRKEKIISDCPLNPKISLH